MQGAHRVLRSLDFGARGMPTSVAVWSDDPLVRATAEDALAEKLEALVMLRWRAELAVVLKFTNPSVFLDAEGGRLGVSAGFPTTPAACAELHKRLYLAHSAALSFPDRAPERFPGRTFRVGKGELLGADAKLYDPAPPSKKSARVGVHLDVFREGEKYPAPGDAKAVVGAIGGLGVFVGSPDPPEFLEGFGGKYDSAVPASYIALSLATRLDLDRLLNRMWDDVRFDKVATQGDAGGTYKLHPSTHLNPYRICAGLQGHRARFTVGSSDHKGGASRVGTHLYLQGPYEILRPALHLVASCLDESDMEAALAIACANAGAGSRGVFAREPT